MTLSLSRCALSPFCQSSAKQKGTSIKYRTEEFSHQVLFLVKKIQHALACCTRTCCSSPGLFLKYLANKVSIFSNSQGASLDVEAINVTATDETEFESLLAANDQLFDFSLLKPLKRSLFEIPMEDIKEIAGNNETQPRSLIPEGSQ